MFLGGECDEGAGVALLVISLTKSVIRSYSTARLGVSREGRMNIMASRLPTTANMNNLFISNFYDIFHVHCIVQMDIFSACQFRWRWE